MPIPTIRVRIRTDLKQAFKQSLEAMPFLPLSLLADVRFAVRLLVKRPWITAMIVGVLAAGIAVNSAVFTLANAVMIRGLPFEDGDRILHLENNDLQRGRAEMRVSYPDYLDWRSQTRTFAELGAFRESEVNISDDSSWPERRDAAFISPNSFGMILRVQALIGRTFIAEEGQAGGRAVALLGHGAWQSRYGGDRGVVGRTVRIDGDPHTIVGVMGEGFRFPTSAELWLPLTPTADLRDRETRRLHVFGRLADSATPSSAQAEMNLIADRIAREYPESNEGVGAVVQTFNKEFNGGSLHTMFVAMLGAVGFVLLIACANVASVQLARAADRAREMSIRTAMGASRWRVVRQVLIESVMLATLGGSIGWALSWFGIQAFDRASVEYRPYWVNFTFDATVFGYLAAICVGAGVLFGLAPALHAARTNVNEVLKEGSRGQTAGFQTRFFSSMMVVCEIAMAMILLVAAGLVLRSVWGVYNRPLGFDSTNVLTMRVSLPRSDYSGLPDRVQFFDRLMPLVRGLPGVVAATSSNFLPGASSSSRLVEIEGSLETDIEKLPREVTRVVSTNYLETLRIPLAGGRDFSARDSFDAPRVAVVSRPFADKYWPRESPIGRRLRLRSEQNEDAPSLTVVGLAADVRENGLRDPNPHPVLYLPYSQDPTRGQVLLLRARGDPSALAEPLRRLVASLDQDLPLYAAGTLEYHLDRFLSGHRVLRMVFLIFAGVALVLAAVGVYALVSDSVSRRIPELGVRMALGADSRSIVRLIVGQGMVRVLVGIAIGLPVAYGAGHSIQALLMGVEPSDPLTLFAIPVFLAVVALVACGIPALRAIRLDPSDALRHE